MEWFGFPWRNHLDFYAFSKEMKTNRRALLMKPSFARRLNFQTCYISFELRQICPRRLNEEAFSRRRRKRRFAFLPLHHDERLGKWLLFAALFQFMMRSEKNEQKSKRQTTLFELGNEHNGGTTNIGICFPHKSVNVKQLKKNYYISLISWRCLRSFLKTLFISLCQLNRTNLQTFFQETLWIRFRREMFAKCRQRQTRQGGWHPSIFLRQNCRKMDDGEKISRFRNAKSFITVEMAYWINRSIDRYGLGLKWAANETVMMKWSGRSSKNVLLFVGDWSIEKEKIFFCWPKIDKKAVAECNDDGWPRENSFSRLILDAGKYLDRSRKRRRFVCGPINKFRLNRAEILDFDEFIEEKKSPTCSESKGLSGHEFIVFFCSFAVVVKKLTRLNSEWRKTSPYLQGIRRRDERSWNFCSLWLLELTSLSLIDIL